MRRYSSFSALFGSFCSKDLYRDVAHAWHGIGFLHLVLLAFIWSAPVMAVFHVKFNGFVDRDFPDLVKTFPELRITKGEVTAAVPQPYTVEDTSNSKAPKGRPFLVLDTTGKINNLEQTEAQILITKTKLHTRDQNSTQHRVQDLKTFPDIELTPAKLRTWMKTFATWAAPVGLLILISWELFIGLIGMMLLAVFGALIGGSNSTVSTSGYIRLASVARTPAYLLGSLFSVLSLNIPMWMLASAGVSIAFMAFAVTAATETPAKPFDSFAPPPPEPVGQTTPPQQTPGSGCCTPPQE